MTDTELKRRKAICDVAGVKEIDDVSDGFHTFRQLYYQRMMLFATIIKQNKNKAWKSLRHEDGELCFGGGWFIVGIDTPEGSYTYHYEDNYYSLFDCKELEREKHWDGHTEKDVTRLLSLPSAQPKTCEYWDGESNFCALHRPSAQPTQTNTPKALETLDCISRQAVIAKFEPWLKVEGYSEGELNMLKAVLFELTVMPPAVSSSRSHENDLIGRQAAIDEVSKYASIWMEYDGGMTQEEVAEAALNAAKRTLVHILEELPSTQPERTCVNCGRTVNNGGWYADGRTRCPIEEHYALPKDGFCHLWEKRNVTDDDYPERREG